jgi:hypothetical protein
MATDPQENPTPDEVEVAHRSLGMTLVQAAEVIGAGAASGATNAVVSNWLQGDDTPAEPAPDPIVLPPGVHPNDD